MSSVWKCRSQILSVGFNSLRFGRTDFQTLNISWFWKSCLLIDSIQTKLLTSQTFGGINIILFVIFLHKLSQFGTKQLLIVINLMVNSKRSLVSFVSKQKLYIWLNMTAANDKTITNVWFVSKREHSAFSKFSANAPRIIFVIFFSFCYISLTATKNLFLCFYGFYLSIK